MANSLGFNAGQARTIEREIRRVDVATGSLVVTAEDSEPVRIDAGEGRDFDNVASLTLHAPVAAKAAVTYFDDPEPRKHSTVRGDSGGSGGSYESRTVKELRELARDRRLQGYSDMTKDELIGALRG
jgi:Rho termination factor-like protein